MAELNRDEVWTENKKEGRLESGPATFFQVGTSGPTGTVRWATAELACATRPIVGSAQWGGDDAERA